MQERPFDYPGSQTTEEPFVLATELGRFTVDDESGEAYDRYATYAFSALADDEEIAEYVANHHPSTFCQHEHDCCGRFYAGTALWERCPKLDSYTSGETQTVVVKQGYACNI